MSGSDSDVILIDSDDDGSCTRGGGARDGGKTGGGEAPSLPEARRDSPSEADASEVIIDVDACIDLEEDGDGDDANSSSSASSGIPSPWKAGQPAAMAPDRPPSVIHTKSPTAQPAKTSGLSNESFHMDEMSGTDTANARECSPAKPPAKKTKQKKGRWGKRRKASKSDSTSCDSSIPSSVRSKSVATHFHCYLLRSLNPDHPLKSYIGFTTHPQRRIRQHNGELKNAGAWRTKRAGRPWTFVCVVHGFSDKIAALQFEWAWQNVHKSKAFREAVGCDKLAKKMRRRYGPKARLDELRILLRECLPFSSLYSLTVFFPEQEYHDIFRDILSKNAKSSDDDGAGTLMTNIEVCSLENMPVAKETAALRAKKKAAREARKAQKKSKKKADDASNASDWPESASLMMDDGSCWSDMLDNGDDGSASEPKRNIRLKTIGEIDSSIDLGSSSSSSDDDSSKRSAAGSKEKRLGKGDGSADDISKDFMSLSLDASKKARRKDAKDSDDLSTISSDSQSECSMDADSGKRKSAMAEKENRGSQNEQLDCSMRSMKSPTKNGDASEDGSVVDLCSP